MRDDDVATRAMAPAFLTVLPMALPEPRASVNAADCEASSCAGCSGRRDFLRESVAAAVALIGLSGVVPVQALSALTRAGSAASVADGVRYPIPPADGVSIDNKNQVILCRSRSEVFAFALACPHQNTALRALPANAGFQCPRHKSRYQPDGTFVSGRATRNMDRLPITRESDVVVVNTTAAFESDTHAAQWAAAFVKL